MVSSVLFSLSLVYVTLSVFCCLIWTSLLDSSSISSWIFNSSDSSSRPKFCMTRSGDRLVWWFRSLRFLICMVDGTDLGYESDDTLYDSTVLVLVLKSWKIWVFLVFLLWISSEFRVSSIVCWAIFQWRFPVLKFIFLASLKCKLFNSDVFWFCDGPVSIDFVIHNHTICQIDIYLDSSTTSSSIYVLWKILASFWYKHYQDLYRVPLHVTRVV